MMRMQPLPASPGVKDTAHADNECARVAEPATHPRCFAGPGGHPTKGGMRAVPSQHSPSLGLNPSSSTSIWLSVIFMYCWSLGLREPPAQHSTRSSSAGRDSGGAAKGKAGAGLGDARICTIGRLRGPTGEWDAAAQGGDSLLEATPLGITEYGFRATVGLQNNTGPPTQHRHGVRQTYSRLPG
jgi:hypothetical protein